MNLDEKKKFIINFMYLAVWFAISYAILKLAAGYLLPFIIGLIIAYCVQRPSVFIANKTKLTKNICAAILSVFVFILAIVLLSLLVWLLYSQLNNLIRHFSHYGDMLKKYIEDFYRYIECFFDDTEQLGFKKITNDTLNSFIGKITAFLSNTVTAFIKMMPNLLISCVITVVATCYISKDYDRLKKFVNGFIEHNIYKKLVEIKNIFSECFLKLIGGYFRIFVITFCELLVGLLLLGVKNFFIIAFFIAVIDVFPVVGTGAVLLPWSVVNFLQSDYRTGIGLTALYILIAVVRNFVEPKIIGKQIGINPIFTLLFIFLGLKLGGMLGMLILPIVLTVIFTYYRRKISEDSDVNL